MEDISRTGATFTVNIEMRGTQPLTYGRLVCHETDGVEEVVCEASRLWGTSQFILSDLNPGTSYTCYLDAGTKTAVLKSDDIQFTTLPLEIPNVSPISLLSTGPTGVIVSFDISDNGGAEIAEAGCELTNLETSESRRIIAPANLFDNEVIQLSVTGLTPGVTYTIMPFASNYIGEANGNPFEFTTTPGIVLTKAGIMSELFESDTDIELTSLNISGFMNGDDFLTLRRICGAPGNGNYSISSANSIDIDIRDVTIVDGGRAYDGARFTENDKITAGLFSNCARLRSIVLPNSAVCVAHDAFARCNALETITIGADAHEILPSRECPALTEIIVTEANRRFIARDGILFVNDYTGIIWVPAKKTGRYSIPASTTSIRESSFAGSSLSFLEIPGSVTAIGRNAFADSSIVEITLPDRIANIPEGMLQNCRMLTSVWLGAGTEFIGNYAFKGSSVRNLFLNAAIPPYTTENALSDSESDIFSSCTLHIPKGSKKIYTNHSTWGKFTHIVEL